MQVSGRNSRILYVYGHDGRRTREVDCPGWVGAEGVLAVRERDIQTPTHECRGHRHGVDLVDEECERKDAPSRECASIWDGGSCRRRYGKPHPRCMLDVVWCELRGAYERAVGKLSQDVQGGRL